MSGADSTEANQVFCPQTTTDGCINYQGYQHDSYWIRYNSGTSLWAILDTNTGLSQYVQVGDCSTDLTTGWVALTQTNAPSGAAVACGPTPTPTPSPSPAPTATPTPTPA